MPMIKLNTRSWVITTIRLAPPIKEALARRSMADSVSQTLLINQALAKMLDVKFEGSDNKGV